MSMDRMLRQSEAGHSPCVGHCTDDSEGFCLSCRRHRSEVDRWRDVSEGERQQIWARLPGAIDQAGGRLMRLPLSPEDIAELAVEILKDGGRWAAGYRGNWFYGALHVRGLEAKSADASLHVTLDFSTKVRALAWIREGTSQKFTDSVKDLPLALVVPRGRVSFSPSDKDCNLGLTSVRLLKNANGSVLETALATLKGKAIDGIVVNHKKSQSALPPDLPLNENYALGAILLPKNEPDLR